MEKKKLYKSANDKLLAGLLGGFAEYFGIDSTIVRLIYVLISLFSAGFPGLLFYIICAIIIPEPPFNVEQ